MSGLCAVDDRNGHRSDSGPTLVAYDVVFDARAKGYNSVTA